MFNFIYRGILKNEFDFKDKEEALRFFQSLRQKFKGWNSAARETEDFSGIVNDISKRTFMTFDLLNNKVMIEGSELFPDALSWARAVTIMKKAILSDYQGDPNCDLFFAPKQNGFSMSCIGVDYSLGGKQISLTKDIPISMVQEFLTPSVLSDVTQ